ncbi:MAG: hypothetical protein K1X94_03310, partial [Sandaracinaceae bacterium]|nr:hypothetical protein [Sandaracinaceae bacterium]
SVAFGCAPGPSSTAMLRKLRRRPRVLAALGGRRPTPRRRDEREQRLALVAQLDRDLVELLAAIALDATVREQATPTGGRALTAYELAATRDLLERLERVKRARPTGEVELGATATDGPIPADATGADPAGVERAAP